MLLRLKLYAIGVASAALALLAIFYAGKRSGAAAVKAATNAARLKSIETANSIEDEINAIDDPYLVDRARRWVRKDE